MKLLASKFGALALLGIALTVLSVILFSTGAAGWGAALLALAVTAMFGLVLLSHGYAVRTAVRAREVQQRDTRTLNHGIDRASKDAAVTRTKVAELAGSFDAAGVRTAMAAGSKSMADDATKAARREMQKASTGNSVGGGGAYFGIGAEFEYGERASKAPGHFETFALRAKSVRMRDAFARSATNLQFDYAEMLHIVRALRAGKAPGAGAVVKNWSHKGVLATARVVANQRLTPSDSGDAVLLFRLVKDVFGVDKLGRSDAYVFAEA
ncbi:MAG: hypothetical protein ACTHYR_11720, partial [Brachybacterium sp.]